MGCGTCTKDDFNKITLQMYFYFVRHVEKVVVSYCCKEFSNLFFNLSYKNVDENNAAVNKMGVLRE